MVSVDTKATVGLRGLAALHIMASITELLTFSSIPVPLDLFPNTKQIERSNWADTKITLATMQYSLTAVVPLLDRDDLW